MPTYDFKWPKNKGSGLAFMHFMYTQNAMGIRNLKKCMNARPDPQKVAVVFMNNLV